MYAVRSSLGRRTISTSTIKKCYDPRNRISGAFNPLLKREGPSMVKQGDPLFLTKPTFIEHMKAQRVQSVGADLGVKPTKMQKLFLIATKMYKTEADIPAYVASGTMNRMHDRMRILSTSLAVLGFFVLFYYCHRANVGRVMRRREDGTMIKS
ncbi:hypothetical protein OESDEN_07161 [Oesophagostomum dentatum]|uniref:Uncharacterized protein n=1 Tax=Oesophagostomum dentatum TaxID=61180 RepID=A0A0B1T6R5_OESDE|nr:hypothetical protein OESDEN_07161 [Oesophagostomum dentatum]